MSMQVLVIGLGQFGTSLARTLSERGAEVIAVDIEKDLVDVASAFIDDAICLDATDEVALSKLSPKDRDVVVCAIGSREASILTTALLMQMGCQKVIARATDKVHERILRALGVQNVINPDAEYGKKFAHKIMFQNVIADDISDNLELLEFNAQPFMIGKNLVELALPNKYGIIVAAIKRNNKLARPFPNERLVENDKLLLVCNDEAIAKMLRENN